MSNRSIFFMLKYIPREQFLRALDAISKEFMESPTRSGSRWGGFRYQPTPFECRAYWQDGVVTVTPFETAIAIKLSRQFACPYLELRAQEGNHWDFALYNRAECVADFSTHVAYWEERTDRPRPWRQGNAQIFASVWGIELGRIERYLVDWAALPKESIGREKAYEPDQFPYGDCDQIYDVLTAFGGVNSWWTAGYTTLSAVGWKWKDQPQPLHRRFVAKASLLLRGSYPDMPAKPITARLEHWRERRHTRWLLKHHPEVFVESYDGE